MQYKVDTEKMIMMNNPNMPAQRPLSLDEDRNVQHTRKILIIILGVLVALSMMSLASGIVGFGSMIETKDGVRNAVNAEMAISILFYSFGLFVAYRYHQTGLRVFAWLGVIELIILGIAILFFFVVGIGVIVATAKLDQDEGKVMGIPISVGVFISVFVLVGCFILTLIIVLFAFKLARLIEANKRLTIQQI